MSKANPLFMTGHMKFRAPIKKKFKPRKPPAAHVGRVLVTEEQRAAIADAAIKAMWKGKRHYG